MSRYFACIAYECEDFREAWRLVLAAWRRAPRAFVADRRNWRVVAACLAGLVLPAPVHRGLERLAVVHRDA